MKNETLPLIKTKRDLSFFSLFIFVIFLFNILFEYQKYRTLVDEEVYKTQAIIINTYKNNSILKLQNADFIFYTENDLNVDVKKQDKVEILFISKYVTFYKYLKGFFVKIIDIRKIQKKNEFRDNLALNIKDNHKDSISTELFQALFLAYPISSQLREFCTNLGISHLVAISGFHLSVLSLCLYFILNVLYSPFHQKYLNYRNKKFDILLVSLFFLFLYLLLTNLVPSLLRAFTMLCVAFFMLRFNIKLFSFYTLFLTLIFILSIFPKYIFSLSLWFSIVGVFYIFLFIQYFKELPKFYAILFFNFWIFFAFNPIIHYFFYNTSFEQLLSPFITLAFTIFYPFELFLHFIGYGNILDVYILAFIEYKMNVFEVETPFLFFAFYIVVSLFSIKDKRAFVLLNILIVGFNLYLYMGK